MEKNLSAKDLKFFSNNDFWSQALISKLYAGQIIKLQNFKMLEWIPNSPGLFHTQFGRIERERAFERHFEKERRKGNGHIEQHIIELRPGDKRSMVKGGIGSLRLGPKKIDDNLQYIMCATSNGVSHEGIVVLLKPEHYSDVITEIKANKNPTVNITGRIMILPKELSLISNEYNREVPKFYIEVEEIELLKNDNPNQGLVSVAITYTNEEEIKEYNAFSYSFCQFSPSATENNLDGVTDWLRNYAIKYSQTDTPLIIGDFDEYYNHFEKVQFPIIDIANGMISIENLHKFQKLFNFNINETTMGDKNIFNNSQIGAVGSKAKANNKFEQNNYNLPENLNFDILSQELSKLKDSLKSNAETSEQFNAISAVVEAENAAKKKDGNKVIQHLLSGGKWVLNTAKDIGVEVVAELINKQMK
ncbi:hypothetical protein GTZ96_017545 [Flavobacterium sp. BBQ-18]|nr:hypothetical protein [Flavobacterium undicola]